MVKHWSPKSALLVQVQLPLNKIIISLLQFNKARMSYCECEDIGSIPIKSII